MVRSGLKPVWKKRMLRASMVLAFAVFSAYSPWTKEYFAHREAVLSSSSDTFQNPHSPDAPAFSGILSSPGGASGPIAPDSSGFGLLVPDLAAEARETVLV